MFHIKRHVYYGLICFVLTLSSFGDLFQGSVEQNVKYSVVHSWAEKLGLELWHLGDFITRRKEVQESFKQAQVVPRMGSKIVENIASEIKMMMELKISAVRRIMDTAENTALSHQYEKADVRFSYYNAKEMIEPGETPPTEPPRDFDDSGVPKIIVPPKEIVLTPMQEFFDTPVNTTVSTVHVPTNVFDRAENVIKDIKWSENLDQIFRDNYKKDPTLSWQFFGSSTGFMRQFPASKWEQDPVDLYDCRLRSWYIEAATSPKDIVVLMDSSGSMTGQRGDIAKHVVNTILDTLGTNDFVNIFKFSDHVVPVVPCFRDILAQATLGNVREFKLGLEEFKTKEIANYTAALIKAFEILELYRTESLGAHCNQAIMIISDGAPFGFKEIFEQYNWQNLPYMPVRVFTYLIGKEIADASEIKSMACDNQGYHVDLSDLAEVREEVLKYIPVMARPLVLGKYDHPVIWTQVYADVVDPKMTDWLWEVRQCEEQKSYYVSLREQGYAFFTREEEQKRMALKEKKILEQYTENEKYHFMTTVSMPVFDRRENATRIANLLGVAGTDVPIRDIKKLLMPFTLGVNGYAFIVTNNGFILVHPDFRPIFQDILKPAYNSVDMLEVELLDDDSEPRDFNPILLGIRDSIINQSIGSKWIMVKQHYDKMKRVVRMKRQYFWAPIQNTPFTLIVTFPEQYGINTLQVRSEDEIHRLHVKGSNMLNYFSGRHWKIHPDWLYCKQSNETFLSPEMELLYFLDKMVKPGWKWPLNRTSLPPEHTAAMYSNSSAGRIPPVSDKDSYYCDRYLMQSLVFDARVTEWFTKNTSFGTKDDKGNEFKQRFGITVAFLATHSGLTRWHEFHLNKVDEIRPEQEFSTENSRSIDEIWYKRAVEQHFVEPQSFVYSVPFDSGENPRETLVTASHAVFHTEGGKSAPAAVVGFQFQHSALHTLFRNITGNCADCKKTCASDELDCYILDDDGYVIISPSLADTGKFFGEVNGNMMYRLIEERIYKEVIIYDYQAVCFEDKGNDNASNRLLAPFMPFYRLLRWIFYSLWFFLKTQIIEVEAMDNYFDENSTDYSTNNKEWQKRVQLNRTRLQSCDHVIQLYKLYNEKDKSVFKKPANGCERPFVVIPIPASNLILLVVDAICPRNDPPVKLSTKPIPQEYSNISLACHKPQYPRIRPSSCINKHANESSIELCGHANYLLLNYTLMMLSMLLTVISTVNCF